MTQRTVSPTGLERAEAVVRLHQFAEARFVRFHDDVNRHLRKIHVLAPTTDSPNHPGVRRSCSDSMSTSCQA